jgi:purine nucleoside permease
MVSGTTSRCAVQIMALAADPRFDLTHTYFVLSGIGGGFPRSMSLASAVWVQRVVDGNPAFEIDSREIPADWPVGLVAIGATKPGKGSANVDSVPAAGASDDSSGGVGTVAFKLNPSLVKWAYELTKDVPIPDSAALRAFGARFAGYPVAQQPPSVIKGDSIASDRFFHGEIMARWAEDWDRIYTRGAGKLAISDCEDAGVCIAMQRLAQMGRVDFNRLLILRTACNFTVPPAGVTAEEPFRRHHLGLVRGGLHAGPGGGLSGRQRGRPEPAPGVGQVPRPGSLSRPRRLRTSGGPPRRPGRPSG